MKWSFFTRLLGDKPPLLIVAVGFVLAGFIGAIDYYTGFELSLSVFYLAPVGLVAWFAPRWAGFFLCGISALIWLTADFATGHTYSYWWMPWENAGVRLGFFIVTAHLLHRLKARLRHEEILARTDGLTQVLNARAFTEVSERLMMLADRHRHPIAVSYIDIDDFKTVNDTQGHSAGDRVLQDVASAILQCVRSTDVVGRMGGDEFAVVMPETGHTGAQTAFAKIHGELKRYAAEHGLPIGFRLQSAFPGRIPFCRAA